MQTAEAGGSDAGDVDVLQPAQPGYCPGEPRVTADQTPCREHSDCGSGSTCAASPPSSPVAGCGAGCTCPPANAVSCASAEQCESGKCVLAPAGTGCAINFCVPSCNETGCKDGYACVDHQCAPLPCGPQLGCGDGARCDPSAMGADEHGCAPLHCSEAGAPACPTNSECTPGARAPGCVVRPCTADADCACGSCVRGACAARPGVCVTPSAAGRG